MKSSWLDRVVKRVSWIQVAAEHGLRDYAREHELASGAPALSPVTESAEQQQTPSFA